MLKTGYLTFISFSARPLSEVSFQDRFSRATSFPHPLASSLRVMTKGRRCASQKKKKEYSATTNTLQVFIGLGIRFVKLSVMM